ncbi:hypothetical protein C0995_007993, partial [Termitomyces sp. Mi166
AEKSQQDFERHQNAVHQQATSSGVPLRALSDVETTTSKVVDEEDFEILQATSGAKVARHDQGGGTGT